MEVFLAGWKSNILWAYLGIGGIEHVHLFLEVQPLDLVDEVLLHACFTAVGEFVAAVLASEGFEEAGEACIAGFGGWGCEMCIVDRV